mmetsp:Transcript_46034/g.68548  ORF Transcript_46034/g.68548 Transcript_46034/m.68548 type:complete len:307 (-) Transcript_46034:76-996(-)
MDKPLPVVEDALRDGEALIDGFSRIEILEEREIKDVSSMWNDRVRIFVGTIDGQEVLGVQQTHQFRSSKKLSFTDSFPDGIHREIPGSTAKNNKEGFELNALGLSTATKEPPEVSSSNQTDNTPQHYEVNLHSFFDFMPAPSFMRQHMKRSFPMKARVVVSRSLSRPLVVETDDPENSTRLSETLCYAFTKERVGPTFLGFGPGKFERAIKHYSLSQSNEEGDETTSCSMTMTGLIAPRSKQIMNIHGFCPLYQSLKALDTLTFGVFNIFENIKTNIEFYLMDYHAKVHKRMLEVWLQNEGVEMAR